MEAPVVPLSDIPGLVKSTPWDQVTRCFGMKACLLAKASNCGLPIPQGFVVTKPGCAASLKLESATLCVSLFERISSAIKKMETATGLQFGGENPLLLILSGPSPAIGVPFCGLNDFTVRMLERMSGDKSFAFDCYRRFIRAFGSLVWDISDAEFDEAEDEYARSRNLRYPTKCSAVGLVQITKLHKALIVKYSGVPFPQDVMEQVKAVVVALIQKFSSEHAALYRWSLQNVDKSPSVLVTNALFGAWDDKSYSGAISTHDLVSGEDKVSGVYSDKAFLDDVLEGVCETFPVENCEGGYQQLMDGAKKLAKELKQPVTLEFIAQSGKLNVVRVLQSKFAGFSRFKAAVEMVKSGLLKKEDVLMGMCPGDVRSVMNATLKAKPRSSFCSGKSGAYGCGYGSLFRSANVAAQKARDGMDVVLAARTLRSSDVKALVFCNGSLAQTGGDYSHGLYHARALAKPACTGADDIEFNYDENTCVATNGSIEYGDEVTVSDGEVYITALQTSPVEYVPDENARDVLNWIDDIRKEKMSVLTWAESIESLKESLAIGSDGVGMFATDDLMKADERSLVSYFLTQDKVVGSEVCNRLSSSMSDVVSIVQSQPCSIKALSRPMSEFLPSIEQLVDEITDLKVRKQYEKSFSRDSELKAKEEMLKEAMKLAQINPMMGLRGARLGLIYPELFAMQCRAILTATKASRRRGTDPNVKILLPAITDIAEVTRLQAVFNEVLLEVDETAELGVVIECPRAALTAGRLATVVNLIYIDTDSLTQSTYGYNHQDARRHFLQQYFDLRILEEAPTASIDPTSVGRLMQICVEEAKKANPNVTIYACGSRCFDRQSITFCHSIGIHSIVCPPLMIPLARISATQGILSCNT